MAKKTPRPITAKASKDAQSSTFFPANPDQVFHWWMIVPLVLNPILMINSLDTMGFAGIMTWLALAIGTMLFTIRAPWTILAANPLYILNGVHTVDFYIKAVYIGITMVLAYLVVPSNRKSGEPLHITLPELFMAIYLLMGVASVAWSINPSLSSERAIYFLSYGVGAYLLAKQTKFWRYSSFWNAYVAVALVVGIIEMLMYFLGGRATMDAPLSTISFRQLIAFDWIMSAGRPSTTLAYRAYAGTWMATALPFLLWFMFSKHIKSLSHFLFAGSAFVAVFVATFEIRARSAWIGVGVSFGMMAILFVLQRRWTVMKFKPYAAGLFIAGIIIASLPMSQDLLDLDTNPQALKGTSKENVGNALVTISNFSKVGQNDRFDFWSMSKRIVFEKSSRDRYEHPFGIPAWILGVGLNQFPLYVPMYTPILHNLGAEVHNDWIQAFVELGPIGFIGYCGFMLALLYYALRDSRANSLMLAAVGGILAWVFATQTDFLQARVYGLIWVAAMAAMVVVESDAHPIITIRSIPWSPWLRRAGGLFILYAVVGWGITMWCDRQIYVMLTKGEPVDVIADRIYNPNNWNAYQHGIGKYLIFSPISDMSRALGMQVDKLTAQNDTQAARGLQEIQKKVLNELLAMHPTSYAFLGTLSDMNYRQGNFKEALEYAKRFLEMKPDDWNTTLYCAQVQLEMKDSINAGKTIYRAVQLAPNQGLVQEFWQNRISPQIQAEVLRQMEGRTGLAPIGGSEAEQQRQTPLK
jgi:hypothetical protein